MKDFISRVTFGFLMAQLFPGALVIFGFTCFLSNCKCENRLFSKLIVGSGQCWLESTFHTLLFIFMATGIGMLIHGLNWTVLAWLESKYQNSRESFWHEKRLFLQLLISPVKMLLEIGWLLWAPNVDSLTMEENIHKIPDEKMSHFSFLQDFYLHFAQFYAHTAYALLVTTILSLICNFMRFDLDQIIYSIALYSLTSLFFLLGRIQLGSLFKAERLLKEESKENDGNTIA